MKKLRYTEEQIISILKEYEAGASVPVLSRRHQHDLPLEGYIRGHGDLRGEAPA